VDCLAQFTEPRKIGTIVHIRNSSYGRARVVEFLGPLGPKGARVYRIRVRKKPSALSRLNFGIVRIADLSEPPP
jgi:hypothetical protein